MTNLTPVGMDPNGLFAIAQPGDSLIGDGSQFTGITQSQISGLISSLAGKASAAGLATVATSGIYNDLTGKPTIPAAQVSSDWSASSGVAAILNKPGIPIVYNGTSQVSAPVLFTGSAVVASGAAVFQLTTNGISTGTAMFPNGPLQSTFNYFVNDATASYQCSAVWSNGNKTMTVTANKLTTANILTGVLGQAAANGTTINISIWGS